MAKLYFYYSSMNAGKSASLLSAAHNYEEGGKKTILLTPHIDTRSPGMIASRLGISHSALTIPPDSLPSDFLTPYFLASSGIDCVLVDEAQFLTKDQVLDLAQIVDNIKLPVLCYGIRTDFRGELFEGSAALLAHADKLCEVKSICSCQNCVSKATHQLRIDANGDVITSGDQVMVGSEDRYKAVCRKHFFKEFNKALDNK